MNSPVNLLPWELRRQHLVRLQVARWGRIVLLVFGLVGAVWIQKQHSLSILQREVTSLAGQASPLRGLAARNRKQQSELDKLIAREQLLNQLGAPFEPLQLVGLLSSRSRVQDGGVRIMNLKLGTLEIQQKQAAAPSLSFRARQRRGNSAPAAAVKNKKPIIKSELTLNGLARDDLALSEFVTSLRLTGVFESVELKSTDEVKHESGLTREYHLRCVL